MAKITTSISAVGSGISIHNQLQGLNNGNYIHLTQLEKNKLDNLPVTFPNTTSITRNEFKYIGGSQIFTLSTNYYQVFSVDVQGQGALSLSQYTIIAPNKVEILDTLEINDYVVILYGQDLITTTAPYYTKSEIDVLVVSDNRVFNEIPIGNLDGINATFTTLFQFLPQTVNVFLNGILQRIVEDYNTVGNNTINLVISPGTTETLIINYIKKP